MSLENASDVTTREDLKNYLISTVSGLQNALEQSDLFCAVHCLRSWASRYIVTSSKDYTFSPEDLLVAFHAFREKRYGVWCGGTTWFFTEILNLFDIPATTMTCSDPDFISISHTFTVFALAEESQPAIYISDPHFNLSYYDRSSGLLLSIADIFKRVAYGRTDEIEMRGEPASRPCLLPMQDSPEDNKSVGWCFRSASNVKTTKLPWAWLHEYCVLDPEALMHYQPYWKHYYDSVNTSGDYKETFFTLFLHEISHVPFEDQKIEKVLEQTLDERAVLLQKLGLPKSHGVNSDASMIEGVLLGVVFHGQLQEILHALTPNWYGEVTGQEVTLNEDRLEMFPTSSHDHLVTPFFDLPVSDSQKGYLLATLTFPLSLKPSPSFRFFFQDDDYSDLSPRFRGDGLEHDESGWRVVRAIPIKPQQVQKVRMTMQSHEGKPTCLPKEIKLEFYTA